MQLKSIWTIIIKIAGLYVGWLFIMMLPLFYELVHAWFSGPEYMQYNVSLGFILLQALIYCLVSAGCLYKTGWVVSKLRLNDGFDEEVLQVNIHRSTVIKIVVVLFGALMIADGFPTFCRYLFSYFQRKDAAYFLVNDPDAPLLLFAFLKTIVGYCLVAYSRLAVNFVEKKGERRV